MSRHELVIVSCDPVNREREGIHYNSHAKIGQQQNYLHFQHSIFMNYICFHAHYLLSCLLVTTKRSQKIRITSI